MTPWRRFLVGLALTAVLAGGALEVATRGSDPVRVNVLPEGGSGLRAAPGRIGGPVDPSTPRERTQEKKADAGLPVPLKRAAARLFLVGFAGTTTKASFFRRLKQREWGAVLLDRANVTTPGATKRLVGHVEAVARGAHHLLPLVAAEQLGGREVAVPGIGPAREATVGSRKEARDDALHAGQVLHRRGFDMVLAPSADLAVAGGPWDGRAFSDEPEPAARRVAGAVAGWRAARIAPIVGHYPGEGGASQDPEDGVATVGESRVELKRLDDVPFRAVRRRAPAVQLSGALYADYDGVTPASLDPAIVQGLRTEGFDGTIVSANLTAATLATGGGVGEAAVAALKAGCDLLYVPGDDQDQEDAYRAVIRAVRVGTVPVARVREALASVDRLRRAAG